MYSTCTCSSPYLVLFPDDGVSIDGLGAFHKPRRESSTKSFSGWEGLCGIWLGRAGACAPGQRSRPLNVTAITMRWALRDSQIIGRVSGSPCSHWGGVCLSNITWWGLTDAGRTCTLTGDVHQVLVDGPAASEQVRGRVQTHDRGQLH